MSAFHHIVDYLGY